MTTVVVLGDVHGNARALRSALSCARQGPVDQLVFIGDLLTYGHDVEEVLELVAEAQSRDNAVLLMGNHDQMYFDLAEDRGAYFDALPAWIQESVKHTLARLDISSFKRLRWQREYIVDNALFAHANPFGFGDWTYLNGPANHSRAVEALRARGSSVGVFGHTHRPRWNGEIATVGSRMSWSGTDPLVVNVGAVGQPRDVDSGSVLVRLDLSSSPLAAVFERVQYDVEAHVSSLRQSHLSSATLERLISFFQAS